MLGAVATGDVQTTDAAAEVLKAGGNALDAIIAGALASFVAEPLLSSPGGSGVLTVCCPDGTAKTLDFFSNAPLSTLDRSALDFSAVEVDFGSTTQIFHVGRGSAAVPHALDGLAVASDLARLPLKRLIEPAVKLAKDGATMSAPSALVFSLLSPILRREALTEARFLPEGVPAEGDVLRLSKLAELFVAFAEHGGTPPHFRDAVLAEFGASRGGRLTAADFETPIELRPASGSEISGGTLFSSPRMGGQLVSKIAKSIVAAKATNFATLAQASQQGSAWKFELSGNHLGSTTHLSVIDRDGMAASLTLTNGEGCGATLPEYDTQLNNFLGEEDLSPHGFFSHAPGEALPTMVAPTILRSNRGVLATGSGGSNRIRSVVAEVIARVCLGANLEEATLAPRVHVEGSHLWYERIEDFSSSQGVKQNLTGLGVDTTSPFDERAFFFGGVHSVMRDVDGEFHAFADPRRGGSACIVRSA